MRSVVKEMELSNFFAWEVVTCILPCEFEVSFPCLVIMGPRDDHLGWQPFRQLLLPETKRNFGNLLLPRWYPLINEWWIVVPLTKSPTSFFFISSEPFLQHAKVNHQQTFNTESCRWRHGNCKSLKSVLVSDICMECASNYRKPSNTGAECVRSPSPDFLPALSFTTCRMITVDSRWKFSVSSSPLSARSIQTAPARSLPPEPIPTPPNICSRENAINIYVRCGWINTILPHLEIQLSSSSL